MTGNVRDLFEETMIDNEPPLSTNAGDIVAAGRRRRRHRRLGWVAATGTAGIAVVLSASLILPAGGGDAVPGDGTTSATDEQTESPDEAYPVVDTWGEYSDVVRELFIEQAPEFVYNSGGQADAFEMSESGQVSSDDPDLEYEIPHTGSAFLKTADGQPVGSVGVRAYEPGPWEAEPGDERFHHDNSVFGGPIVSCWSGETEVQHDAPGAPVEIEVTETECEDTTTPDGDRMIRVSTVDYYEGKEPHSYENTVVIYRSDETAVVVSGFCGNDDEDDEYGGTCHDIQFDLDQLEAIALGLPKVIITDDGQ